MTAPALSTPPILVPAGLTRDDRHVYGWNDGRKVYWPIPSVTTILRIIDKPAIVGWVRKNTAEFAVDNLDAIRLIRDETGYQSAVDFVKLSTDRRRDKAGTRGSDVHRIAEQMVRGQVPEIPEEIAPYVSAYSTFVRAWAPRFIMVEQMVCSLRYAYAGTFDAIADIGNERWMLDMKTSSGVYLETAQQLVAYARAEFVGQPGRTTRFQIPPVRRFGVIHVVPEGAELVPYAVDDATFQAFLAARALWGWREGPGRTIIGEGIYKEAT